MFPKLKITLISSNEIDNYVLMAHNFTKPKDLIPGKNT